MKKIKINNFSLAAVLYKNVILEKKIFVKVRCNFQKTLKVPKREIFDGDFFA
jgi:hypothetical protein